MSFTDEVIAKDGTVKHIWADSKEDLKAAVKEAKSDEAPVYPNINHPVQKGHDLVAIDGDVNKVLVDGTGAHNSPNDAVNPFSTETDSDVEVVGLEEPAYKSVPTSAGNDETLVVPTDAEVSAAKSDAKPANEVK